jgi:CheY-like chemotaxis protein
MGGGLRKQSRVKETSVKERELEQSHKDELMPDGDRTVDSKYLFERALIVDDSKFNRRMLAKAIEHFFNDIQQAEDGTFAVAMVEESMKANKPYDLIFMDGIMNEMGGVEAVVKIRQLGHTNMIIGLTGSILDDEAERFFQAGAQDLMLKPLLMSHVESILSGNFKFFSLLN